MTSNTQKAAGTDLRRRAITALLGIPFILLLIYLGSPFWDILVISTSLACVLELQRMISPKSRTGLLGMFAITLACFLSTAIRNYYPLLIIVVVFFVVKIIHSLSLDDSTRQVLLRHWLYASLGAMYIGIPLSLLLAIRTLDGDSVWWGAQWTAIAFANNWMTDSMALIGGRKFGRRKLAPKISPGKTVEGAVIGMACGFVTGFALSILVGMPFQLTLIANLAIPILTVLGDLLESWIKRFFAVKDAGTILPGHGGLLDRADGMLLAAPALFLILYFLR